MLWEQIMFQPHCNQMQRSTVGRSALSAISANFQSTYQDVKLALALDLTFKPIEQIAFKLGDLSTAQAGHVNMISLRPPLVKMFFALHVHEIKFIDQAVALQQL